MENSIKDTTSLVASASSTIPSALNATNVDSNERREGKKKFYQQHYLALLDRCEIIQQVPTLVEYSLQATAIILTSWCSLSNS